MLTGFRKKNKLAYEWNWIPEEILYLNNSNTPELHYPKSSSEISQFIEENNILLGNNEELIVFKDINYTNRFSLLQISIRYPNKSNIERIIDEALSYAFNVLQLNKVYGYLCKEQEEEYEMLKNKGFYLEGMIPKHLYWNHQLRDRYIFAIFNNDWKGGEGFEYSEN